MNIDYFAVLVFCLIGCEECWWKSKTGRGCGCFRRHQRLLWAEVRHGMFARSVAAGTWAGSGGDRSIGFLACFCVSTVIAAANFAAAGKAICGGA